MKELRPDIEELEHRVVPSTFTLTAGPITLSADVTCTDGSVTAEGSVVKNGEELASASLEVSDPSGELCNVLDL